MWVECVLLIVTELPTFVGSLITLVPDNISLDTSLPEKRLEKRAHSFGFSSKIR